MIWTIPNILTVGRIVAAPGVALAFVVFDRPTADWVAFCLFAAAAITDFFDGWLARRLNQTSEIGKMLDPIADKAMVIIALMVLVGRPPPVIETPNSTFMLADLTGVLILLPAALIVLREVLVSGLREFLGDVKLPVTRLAKWKTTAQMIAVGVLLAAPLLPGGVADDKALGDFSKSAGWWTDGMAERYGLLLLWIAAILTVATGWDYFRKGLAYIRAREEG